MKYRSITLEQGWIGKSDSASSEKIAWITRETSDCRNEPQQLAYDLKNELKIRFKNSFPRLNSLLHNSLDFGRLFIDLCGKRVRQNEVPVDKALLAKFGSKQFQECVKLVFRLVHLKSLNLPLYPELSGAIFWRAKCTMMKVT